MLTPTTDSAARSCSCPRVSHRHGTRSAYLRDKCRCGPCRAANSAHQRAFHRARAVHTRRGTSCWADAHGTRRRLQALTAAGWSTSQLAQRLGVTTSAISQLRCTKQHRVLASTADDVTTLYEACWWRTVPGRYQARAERHAQAQGWAPPWRWDGRDLDDPVAVPTDEDPAATDEVAIEQVVAGRRVPLTRTERRRAVDELHRRGVSAAAIAHLVGLSTRTVVRYTATTGGVG